MKMRIDWRSAATGEHMTTIVTGETGWPSVKAFQEHFDAAYGGSVAVEHTPRGTKFTDDGVVVEFTMFT